jgi:parallel beta-helix repeat protein
VADGTYAGDGDRDIDFHGKAITLKSENGPENCIIDCNATQNAPHRGFYLHSGEDANSAIIGFTITNGWARTECDPRPPWPCNRFGGGIYCKESSPTISHCRIESNWAWVGAGIHCVASNPVITYCTIAGNRAFNYGGGIGIYSSNPIISNCTLTNNFSSNEGGGIITYNSNQELTNCILWGNVPDEIYMYGTTGSVTASYCDIRDGWPGTGNIDSDPCFADIGYWDDDGTPRYPWDDFYVSGDYHPKSQAGRWDANEGRWTIDEVTSPCIDAGDPMMSIGYEPFPNGGRINMGAYGGTAEASKSYFGGPSCETVVAGDVNGDCIVDFKDFAIMALHWMWEE